jgi:hypothetical protein
MCIFTSVSRLKKIIVLFLILVITFPGQTAHAFAFVPKFIAHYQHHNQAHHKTNLAGFILEHLSDHQHHDSNKDHHDDCPLSLKHAVVQFVYIFRKTPQGILPQENTSEPEEKVQLPAYNFSFSEYCGSIWQPPKIA